MKTKYFLILPFLSLSAFIVGALFKILHWQGADELLISGMFGLLAGGLSLLIKLLTHPKVKDFLNR